MVVLLVVSGIFLLFFSASIFIYEKVFKRRTDIPESVFEPSFNDIPNLARRPVQFKNKRMKALKGYIYYSNYGPPADGVIVLVHGFGTTHMDYLHLIEWFIKSGFAVFSYDNTGCGESEGSSMSGLPNAVHDLECAIECIRQDSELGTLPLFMFGHSWGAYAVTSALAHIGGVTAVVGCCGFNTSLDMLKCYSTAFSGKIGLLIIPFAVLYERLKFGRYAGISGASGVLNSNASVLLIHSKDDTVVPYKHSVAAHVKPFIKSYSRVIIKLYSNRGHNVFRSDASIAYRAEIVGEQMKLRKRYGNNIPKKVCDEYIKGIDKRLLSELKVDLMKEMTTFFTSSLERF
jgi:pimeloyl-ACP methyl ester carboxylesterase